MTFSEAFKMQEETMAVWKRVLTTEAFATLAGIQAARNERQHKSPFDVWRGQDIAEAVHMLAYNVTA